MQTLHRFSEKKCLSFTKRVVCPCVLIISMGVAHTRNFYIDLKAKGTHKFLFFENRIAIA